MTRRTRFRGAASARDRLADAHEAHGARAAALAAADHARLVKPK